MVFKIAWFIGALIFFVVNAITVGIGWRTAFVTRPAGHGGTFIHGVGHAITILVGTAVGAGIPWDFRTCVFFIGNAVFIAVAWFYLRAFT
jgi:hypothetical protein